MGWKPSPAPVFLYIANVSGKIRASDMLMNLLLKGARGTCIFVLSLSPPPKIPALQTVALLCSGAGWLFLSSPMRSPLPIINSELLSPF